MSASDFELLLRPSADEKYPDDQMIDATKSRSPSLMMLVLIASVGVLLYASFLFKPSNHGDLLPYVLVVVAETCLIAQALMSLWTILSSGYDPRDFSFHHARRGMFRIAEIVGERLESRPHLWPMYLHENELGVDVFVTTYGEDLAVIRRTVEAALAIRGRHRTLVLDDGRSDEVRALAAELGADYVRRDDRSGAKAGNINHALSITDGELFVILDADFVPRRDFLHETVPYFANQNVAFVQSPQTYGNMHTLLSRGSGYMQSVFYSLIQPGKNRFNAAFSVGTNVVFRRTAVAEIGGIYQGSKSEDIWTSILLHERGWRSIYTTTVLAVGDTPRRSRPTPSSSCGGPREASRSCSGTTRCGAGRNLTIDQRLQYFGSSTFYLNGIAPGLLLLVPPLHIYFNLTPVDLNVSASTWLLYYAGFYVMQIVVALSTMGSFRWETLMLATASFPIYTHALWNAALRREQRWHVTGRVGAARSPFNYTMPQVLVFLFLFLTTLVGIGKVQATGELSLSLFWNALNTAVLGAFVVMAFRESRAIKRGRAGQRRASTRSDLEVATVASPLPGGVR